MNLLEIKDPSFLKDMSIVELNELAAQIRSFIIEKVSKSGGHLSSNLGIVELTIAMHLVFDSPIDRFIFDVGHQSYVHKILTGRAKDFDSLRQYKGMSGYQKRCESEHDFWEAGHSSTAMAAMAGFCLADKEAKRTNKTIAIVGDGSLNSGLSYEALNYLGHHSGTAPIIILNDNEMSISKNVGAFSKMLTSLRSSKMYVRTASSKRKFPRFVYNWKVRLGTMLRGYAGNITLFDEMGLSYYGPIDGHDIKSLIKFFRIAKKRNKPIVIHVVTKKGKGYLKAEEDAIGAWHGVPKFNIETGAFLNKFAENKASWSSIISGLLEARVTESKNFKVIVPAMTYGSSLVEFSKNHPDRIIDVGICESFAVCFSAALALNNTEIFLPIYSSFLQRAYDQLSHDLARQDIKIVIGIDRAGIVGADGETHQGIYDIAYLRHIPNIEIVQPSDMSEAKQLFDYAYNYALHTVAIRYSKGQTDLMNIENLAVIKKPTWLEYSKEASVNLIAYGETFARLKKHIDENNVAVNLYNALFIKPMDEDMLLKILQSGNKTFIVEDSVKTSGLGSAVLEYASEHDLLNNNIKLIGYPDEFIEHGDLLSIQKQYGLDTESIIKQILKK
ncbi:MAG: 1-deoxy-D-xylulose-5-phosphate synthase [Tenericutes bacterium]|nr:1-deoxy-D-xylulose-5-phosphate synthase [Mycoplasmatota bacterium]